LVGGSAARCIRRSLVSLNWLVTDQQDLAKILHLLIPRTLLLRLQKKKEPYEVEYFDSKNRRIRRIVSKFNVIAGQAYWHLAESACRTHSLVPLSRLCQLSNHCHVLLPLTSYWQLYRSSLSNYACASASSSPLLQLLVHHTEETERPCNLTSTKHRNHREGRATAASSLT
jgi:hypothetical protein